MELGELQQHVKDLAALEKTAAPVVSCYIDVEAWRSGKRYLLDEQVKVCRRDQSTDARSALEQTLARIEAFLGVGGVGYLLRFLRPQIYGAKAA